MASLLPAKSAEYSKLLSNPGKRAGIPDAYLKSLSPSLYAKRQNNTAMAKRTTLENKAYNPMASLSGSEIGNLARLLAGTELDPQISALKNDRKLAIANDAKLGERIGGYYSQLSGALAQSHEVAQGAQADLAKNLAANTKNTLDSMDQGQAQTQKFVADDAALRGSDYSAGMGAQLAADFQKQRQAVQTTMAANDAASNVAGAGWAGLASLMQGVGAMRGADAQTQAANAGANRENKIQSDITATESKRGGIIADKVQALRGTEFEKAVTKETLNIKGQAADTAANKAAFDAKYKTAKLKADSEYRQSTLDLRKLQQQQAHGDRSAALNQRIKEAQARNRQAAQRLDIAQGNLDVARQRANQAGSKIPTAKDVKGQWLPPVAAAHAISDFHRALASPTLAKMKKDGLTRPEMADKLITSSPMDPALVSAVLDMTFNKPPHLSPTTVAKLHRAKIQVSGLGVPVRTVKPTPKVNIKPRYGSSGPAGGDPAGRYK